MKGVNNYAQVKISFQREKTVFVYKKRPVKVKRKQALRNHILTHKSTKKKRSLRKQAYASESNAPAVKKMLPYA